MTGATLASGDLRLLLSEIATARQLLRKFRHFFRHAYALDLRVDKLDRVLELFIPAYPAIDEELVSFVAFVEATIAQLDAAP